MEPTYDKYPPEPHRDYRMMTWEVFLTLREWAQEVADAEGYLVYLVGSALNKLYPRDIDVSIIIPLAEFEVRFGAIPEDKVELHHYLSHPSKAFSVRMPYELSINERIRWMTRVDVKVVPDSWHTQQDKLLLAEPGGKVRIRYWEIPKAQPDTTE